MNKGDCFILEKDNEISVFVGDKAKNVEKLKAISMANQIRDEDHHGRGKVDIVGKYILLICILIHNLRTRYACKADHYVNLV